MSTETRATRRRKLISGLLRENPGLTLTIGYIATSLIGLLFSWSLLNRFGLNILDYTEVTDFLIAALREPLTFLVAASAIPVVYLIRYLNGKEQRFWQRHPPKSAILKRYCKLSSESYGDPFTDIFITVAYAFLFITLYSDWKANQIRAGIGQKVDVEIGWEDDTSRMNRILVGGTTRFLFVFDTDDQRMEAIPHESVLRVLAIKPKPKPGAKAQPEPTDSKEKK